MKSDTEDCRGGGGSSGLLMIVEECVVKCWPVDEEGIDLWLHFRPHCNNHKWRSINVKGTLFWVCTDSVNFYFIS